MEIILGVDGGGTKTKIIATDILGNTLCSAVGKSINYNFISMEEAVINFINTVKALDLSNKDKIAYVSIGNPAMDDEGCDNHANIFIEKLRSNYIFDIHTQFYIKSDAYMALYGLSEGKEGVLIISGTGSMGIAIDKHNNLHTVGGWGFPTNDDGSGYYIAVCGLKAAFDYADGVSRSTTLLNAALEYYKTDKPRNLINVLNSEACTKAQVANFSKVVADCADGGDEVATEILRKAALQLYSYTASLIEKIKSYDCVAGIYGGVFLNNEIVRENYKNYVNLKYPKVKVQIPSTMPEMAAVLYAIKNRGVNSNE